MYICIYDHKLLKIDVKTTFIQIFHLLRKMFQRPLILSCFLFKSLGERWAAVCRWTEERWHKLQEVFMVWQQLLSDQVGLFSISPP